MSNFDEVATSKVGEALTTGNTYTIRSFHQKGHFTKEALIDKKGNFLIHIVDQGLFRV